MRRLLVICAVLAALSVAHPFKSMAATHRCDENCVGTGSVGAYDGGLFTQIGIRSHPNQTPGGQFTASSKGPLIEYKYDPVCDGECTDAAQQRVFDSAGCTGNQSAVWVAARPVNSQGSWVLQGPPECLTPAQQLGYDPAQLQATVDDYFQRIPLPAPQLRIAPADNAVVNLPEIVSADTPPATTFTVDVAPFPTVTINASVSWEWDFGDGATLVTSNPGRPYDANDPDDAGYVSHTYTHPSDGYPLTVTSVWTATYTIQGVPGTLAVDGAVRRTTAHTLAAAEYGSILTGN